jgi:uncharacterized protein YfiM (DUF2279 family)
MMEPAAAPLNGELARDVESNPAAPHTAPATIGNRQRVNPAAPTPSLDRVEAFLRSEIGVGRGFPSSSAIALHMGWSNERSARDALHRLEALGRIRRVGVEDRANRTWGAPRVIWELTSLGAAPRRKWCRGCVREQPASAFQYSRTSVDGLSPICRTCLARPRTTAGRRAARRAAMVGAP